MPIATGTRLGQYEIQEFIGQGAMGLVYRAYHPELERTGAVKVMQAITPDADTVARFRHEAKAIAQLRHPNIVQVYDFGEFQGTPYMIVEYVPGGSLAGRMAQSPLDQPTALKYLRGIAAGLDYAHRHGVVHRDVKPANVLLTAEDTPVLADFGLAKLLQGNSLKSMTGVTTGTPAYMAPEQVTGHNVGPAADRYSLATIAYEMMTGVIPFDGEGLMELLYAQVHRDAPNPSTRNASLSGQVDMVMRKALAKDPAARFDTATGFVEALAAAAGDIAAAPEPPSTAATMVMGGAALASTVPVTRPTAVLNGGAAGQTVAVTLPAAAGQTVAMTLPPAAASNGSMSAHPQPKRRVSRRVIAAIAAAVALLLLMGVCAVDILPGTGLQVNPNPAARGELVTVTASKVPANQTGEIELFSVIHIYAFRANNNGDVREEFRVPSDVELGMHTVKLCWQDACHRSTQLRVVDGLGQLESPTPVANATPTFGVTPTPGVTPRPTGTPRSTPRSTPTSTPRYGSSPTPTSTPKSSPKPSPTPTRLPSPSPSPTPTSNPCPTSTSAAVLTKPGSTVALSGTIPVAGQNFTPNALVTVDYYLNNALKASKTIVVACNGTFSTSFPAGSLLGNGLITANDGARQAQKTFSIVL